MTALATLTMFLFAAQSAPEDAQRHAFDFLAGQWRVHHRSLRIQGNTREWMEYDGTCDARLLMNGSANMEEHDLNAPSGRHYAVGLRSYDSKAGLWSIWWLDERYPTGPLDPPVKGRFENGVGTFYSDDVQDGKPRRTRYLWSQTTARSARWEQAVSYDAGKTWETNWIMEFKRR